MSEWRAVSSMRSVRLTTSFAVANNVLAKRSPIRLCRKGLPNMLKMTSGLPSSGTCMLCNSPLAIASFRYSSGLRGKVGSLYRGSSCVA